MRIFKLVSLFLLVASNCYATTLTIPTTYQTNSVLSSTNLNGNFTAVASWANGGIDNTNIDTASGYRLFETLSSLPAAGTIGRVIFLTTDNSLNFDTGAAWIKSISTADTPVQGNVLYYNGSAWVVLATGTSGQYFKTNGAAANPAWATLPSDTTSYKVGTFTRDTATASGTQAITGVGFQPTNVIFFMDEDASAEASWGMDNGTTASSVFAQSTGAWNRAASSIYDYEGGGVNYSGVISAFGADGFTITWTRTSTPTGTLNISYIAFK
jgi:hypothetical protein